MVNASKGSVTRSIVIVVLIGIPLVGLAAPLVLGQGGSTPGTTASSGAANAPTVLRRATIQRGDLKLTVSATGSIVAKQQSRLSFYQPGRVQDVLVQEGQTVMAGQVLATQDNSAQQANLAQAKYGLAATDASLQKLLLPIDPGEIAKAEANVKAAEAAYSSLAGGISPQVVNVYQLQYQKALQNVQDSGKVLADAGGQFAQDDPKYQKALAAAGQATFQAEIARLRVEQAKGGPALSRATANITYYQALLAQLKAGPSQSTINAAQANYVIAKIQYDQAQHDLDRTQLVAPFAGVISNVNVKVGEVSSGISIIITDGSELYADVNVDETDIGKIQPGQPVEIGLDAEPDVALTGNVMRIAQTAESAASVITYVVRVKLNPTAAALKVGMTANAIFEVGDAKNVVRVPNDFVKLNSTTGQFTVILLGQDGSTTTVPVQLGLQGTDFSEVISGLNEGETVALVTNNPVKP